MKFSTLNLIGITFSTASLLICTFLGQWTTGVIYNLPFIVINGFLYTRNKKFNL